MAIASYEEGFSGDLAFTFKGLPPGVRAFPAIQNENEGEPPLKRFHDAPRDAASKEHAGFVTEEIRARAEPHAWGSSEPCRNCSNGRRAGLANA